MDVFTLKALKGSIKKWENIINGEGIDEGGKNCPLCKLFDGDAFCGECPVAKCSVAKCSGDWNCWNTPYEEWLEHHDDEHESEEPVGLVIRCNKCREIAWKELNFLKSLLPKETK